VPESPPPPERWHESEEYLRGIELFNERKFWESHEAWEEIWLLTDGIQSEFLQGLIQSAAALLKYQRNEFAPALRLYNTAKGRLDLCPDNYMGLNVRAFQASTAACFASVLNGKNTAIEPAAIPTIQVTRDD
jgi:hypothetical protein